jgi:hypothetical protein
MPGGFYLVDNDDELAERATAFAPITARYPTGVLEKFARLAR